MRYPRTVNPRLILVLFAPLLFLGNSCRDDPNPPEVTDRQLPGELKTIFENRNCMNCHRDEQANYNLSFSSIESIREGYRYGSVVVPDNIEYSHLLWHINPDSMYDGPSFPPYMPYNNSLEFDAGNMLSADEYATIKDWIMSGAPDEDGVGMWADRENTSGGKAFFLCSGSDIMGVADGETGAVMRYLTVGNDPTKIENPHYVQHSPDGQYVYVTLIDGGAVEKYSTTNYQRVARTNVNLGDAMAHLEVSGDGRWLLVSNWTTNETESKLIILDAQTLEVSDTYVNGSFEMSHGIALRPDFSEAFVGSNQGSYFLRIELDAENGKFIEGFQEEYSLGSEQNINPYQLLLSEDGNTLYATCDGGNDGDLSRVVVYDVSGDTPTMLQTVNSQLTQCPQGPGASPRLMRIWDNKLFVVSVATKCQAESRKEGAVIVFDIAGDGTLNWKKNIYGLAQRPRGMGFDEKRKKLFVFGDGAGGEDWHHPPPDADTPPGQYNIIDLTTLEMAKPDTRFPQPVDVGSSCYGATFIQE